MIEIVFAHTDEKLHELYRGKLHPHVRMHAAVDGLSALRKIKIIQPQLIISDVQLPFLSGLSLLKYIRNHKELVSTGFIFLTQEPMHEEALNLGANEWIHAHIIPHDQIVRKILSHLKIKITNQTNV